MCTPHLLAFLLTLAAATLLTLVTFSVPFIQQLYFLRVDVDGGIKFGMWGYCVEQTGVCTPRGLGYSFDPQIIPWLTRAIVAIPIAAGLCIITVLVFAPILLFRYRRHHRHDYPHPNFSIAVFLTFIVALLALLFVAGLVGVAITRFHRAGVKTRIGPSVWLAVAAVLVLTILAISSGCGNMCRGRYGRSSRFVSYNV